MNKIIDSGSWGIVSTAHCKKDNKTVAIKKLKVHGKTPIEKLANKK